MSEIQSYLFDFSRVDDFFDNWNVRFHTAEMDGTSKFQLVLASYSPDNIKDCLTATGVLDTSVVSDLMVQDCGLVWGDDIIKLGDDVTFNIGDNVKPLKAVFLRNKATGYVLGYSININSFNVTNQVVYDGDSIFYSITDGVRNG